MTRRPKQESGLDSSYPQARILYILLVEDHADTRVALKLYLQMLGHRTAAAGNVREALEIAAERTERFDLLISDLQLPDGDGWELLRRLEEAGHRPRQAIALSGWGNDEDATKSRTAGFQAHLVKPTAPGILEAAVANASAAIEDASGG